MKFFSDNASGRGQKAPIPDNMSNEEDVDLSDDGEDSDSNSAHASQKGGAGRNSQYFSQAEKRAHHNALERKRRDHIKDSFTSLRDSVPSLQGEKASRAQILKKAAEYIQFMRRKNTSHQQDIDDLKKHNNILEAQIRQLERARATGNFDAIDLNNLPIKGESGTEESSEEVAEEGAAGGNQRVKKLKPNTYVA